MKAVHVMLTCRCPQNLVADLDLRAKAAYRSRSKELLKRLAESMANERVDEHGVIVSTTAALKSGVTPGSAT